MRRKRLPSRAKKTVAILAGLSVLTIGAVAGVAMFIQSDDTAQAATEASQVVIEQNQGTNNQSSIVQATNPNVNPSNPNERVSQNENSNGTNNATTTSTAGNNQGQLPVTNEYITTEATTNRTDTTVAETTVETDRVEENADRTDTTVGTTSVAPAGQPSEFITYRDAIISEDFLVGWTSAALPIVVDDLTGRDIYRPILEIEKKSYTEIDLMTEDGSLIVPEEAKYNTTSADEVIAYEIKVKNTGNLDANNVEIIDTLPKGTTFILAGQDGKEENGTITWNASIPKQKEITFGFLAKVNNDTKGTITNIATVDSEKTNEVKNTIITASKVAEVYRNGKLVEIANVGDEINYTVIVKNTGDVDGVVNVKDTIPENTKLVSDILLDGKKIDEKTMNAGKDVTIKAGNEVELKFTVKVEKVEGDIISTAIVGRKTVTQVTKTANLEILKKVSTSKDGEYSENVILEAEEIAYIRIEMKNTGSEDLKLELKDLIKNKELDLYDGSEKVEGIYILTAGASKILTTTYTMTQEDIDNKKALENIIIASDENIPDAEDSVTITPIEAQPSISIEKITETVKKAGANTAERITENTMVRPGDIITYTLTVKNDGKLTLHDIEVIDTLDITYEGENIKANEPIDVMKSLAPKEEKAYTVEYTVTQADIDSKETIKNTAKATDGNVTDESETDKEVPVNPDVELTITKIWKDNSDKVKVRPKEIEIKVLNGSETVSEVVLKAKQTGDDIWTTKINGLPKFDNNGKEIKYKAVEEIVPEHYKKSEDGLTVTNTIDYSTFKKDVTITKEWEDDANKVKARPENVVITLKSSSSVQANSNYTLTGNITAKEWTVIASSVREYDNNGDLITYTAEEGTVPTHYTKTESGLKVTNTIDYSTFKKDVTITKEWKDDDNKLGARPENVVITLKSSSNVQANKDYTLTGNKTEEKWTTTALNVREYDDNGDLITYTAEEETVPTHYTKSESGLKVTNTIDYGTFKKNVTITEEWKDDANKVEARPENVVLTLKSSSSVQEDLDYTLTGNMTEEEWTAIALDVRKYDNNGDLITYTVEEESIPTHYTKSESGLKVINTIDYKTFKKDVNVISNWDDNGNSANARPNKVTFTVSSSSTVQEAKTIDVQGDMTATIWTATINGVREYDNSGNPITYTATENVTPTYYTKFEDGLVVTNRINFKLFKKDIIITKVWDDDNNALNVRPNTIDLTLRSGSNVQPNITVTLKDNGTNTWTATVNVREFDNSGVPIGYTLLERNVPQHYTNEIEGYTVKNKLDYDSFTGE